jgi:hypothetical protein
LKPGAGSGQRVAWNIFIHMDGLRMLPEVVKSRKPSRAMTLEGSFACVLASPCQLPEFRRYLVATYRMCRARCSLLVKLKWQGGKSVQKNRCPFFFFEVIFASLLTLSSSETSTPSSSPPPISTSCEPTDCDDLCELSLISRLGGVLTSCDGVKGVEGSGR